MIVALLPVKTFTRSKERLAAFLTPSERSELARVMFEDVWAVLHEALAAKQGLDRLLAVSAEPYVIELCRRHGVACLEEDVQLSHSSSVKRATRWAIGLGANALLSVPIDTPGITAAEIFSLLDLRRRAAVVIVPSADGRGTNALLRTPPDAIDPHFGSDSCNLHAQAASEKGLKFLVAPSSGFAADIDTPEELHSFAARSEPCLTRTFARELLSVSRGVSV